MNKVMKELSIEEKAKAYDRALEAVKSLLEVNPSDEGIQNWVNENFPELREASEDERIRKALMEFLVGKRIISNDLEGINIDKTLAWLEKQVLINEEAEKEKNDYVSGQFLYCKGSFNEFKEGESYWIEYIGNDTYIGRSDNILNQKFHITPRQLYTWLDPRHPEKQDEQEDVCINIKDNQELPNKEETGVSDEYQQGYRDGFKCGKEYVEKYPQEFNLQPMQLIQECEHENLIKERLTNAVNICYTEDGGKEAPFKEELIAYINKHCEWSEEDAKHFLRCLGYIEAYVEPRKDDVRWFKELKDRVQPKLEWSEEEHQIIKDAASFILSCVNTVETKKEEERLEELADKLQDLRPQSTWKPSEYQLNSLQVAINIIGEQTLTGIDLKKLLEQLNKL